MNESPEQRAEAASLDLVRAVARAASANGWTLENLRGIALYDSRRDERVRSVGEYARAADAMGAIPLVVDRMGAIEAPRLALQFVYEYFKQATSVQIDETLLGAHWDNFAAEIHEPLWRTRGVANLRNFESEKLTMELGDDVSIRGRDFEELSSLGFGRGVLDGLSTDWHSEFGASSFVIVAESVQAKRPDNVIMMDGASIWTKAQRVIGSLRLVAAGDVGMGPMFIVRPARFNVGLGGTQSVGISIPRMGSAFKWTPEVETAFGSVYTDLAQLEQRGYGRAAGNLDLALRSFMGTYDRWPQVADSVLLDSVTALEAVLGSGTEIAFKLAFRVAALLAGNDSERAALFETMKGFYDTRSALVHGGRLKEKHATRLAGVDEIRGHVRRLLRAFVHFAAGEAGDYDKSFFQAHLARCRPRGRTAARKTARRAGSSE